VRIGGAAAGITATGAAGLYPEGLRAGAAGSRGYAEVFRHRRVHSTFYRLASTNAVGVGEQTARLPFRAKASRYLIHIEELRDIEAGIGRFYERIRPLAARRRWCGLGQLPDLFHRRRRHARRRARLPAAGAARLRVPRPELVLRRRLRAAAPHGAALRIVESPRRPFIPVRAEGGGSDWPILALPLRPPRRRGNYSENELRAVGRTRLARGPPACRGARLLQQSTGRASRSAMHGLRRMLQALESKQPSWPRS